MSVLLPFQEDVLVRQFALPTLADCSGHCVEGPRDGVGFQAQDPLLWDPVRPLLILPCL